MVHIFWASLNDGTGEKKKRVYTNWNLFILRLKFKQETMLDYWYFLHVHGVCNKNQNPVVNISTESSFGIRSICRFYYLKVQ